MNGEMEEADYEAQCQAEAEAEGQAMDEMAAQAENEAEQHNEEIRAQEEFIKEHPGLKGKGGFIDGMLSLVKNTSKDEIHKYLEKTVYKAFLHSPVFTDEQIHKTQIDKENLIDTLEHWLQSEQGLLRQIKEELGL